MNAINKTDIKAANCTTSLNIHNSSFNTSKTDVKPLIFEGTATALITPFKDGKVDVYALEGLLDRQLEGGVSAVVVLGTTGEPATMSQDEKELVLKAAVRRLNGKIKVIAGAGSNSTQSSILACRRAEELGADGLLVVTPYYNKCTQAGLIAHYSQIAASTALPIICYNVPSRTGVNMLPATFCELAEIDNIVGLKEASGNMEQIEECIRLASDKAAIYSGDDGLTVPVMAMGGQGVISVVSNIYPALVSNMTSAALAGDFRTATKMQLDMLPLVKAMFSEVNPIPVKKAAEIKGLCNGELRLPLTPLTVTNAERLRDEMKKIESLYKIC